MTTIKASLKSHSSGSDSICILAGTDSPNQTCAAAAAIKQTWERKYGCKVLSITQPYGDETYHIEHSGRGAMIFSSTAQAMVETIVYSDELTIGNVLREL